MCFIGQCKSNVCKVFMLTAVLTNTFILMVQSEGTFKYNSENINVRNNSVKKAQITFSPKHVQELLVDKTRTITWNMPNLTYDYYEPKGDTAWKYVVTYEPDNAQIAIPVSVPIGNNTLTTVQMADSYMKTSLQNLNTFGVQGVYLGRTKIKVVISRQEVLQSIPTTYSPTVSTHATWNITSGNFTSNGSSVMNILNVTEPSPLEEILLTAFYSVSVIRHERLVDNVFRWVVAVIGTMTNFAVGCASDKSAMLSQFQQPGGVIITIICKVLLLPPLAMGISEAFRLSDDASLGLLFTACIPSGGLGFFLTAAFHGNRDLAMAIHLANTILALGNFALWMFILSLYMESVASLLWTLEWFVAWLTCTLVAYLLGVALQQCLPSVTQQLLNWLIKPVLLLFVLVYVTIGMYINSYAFVILDTVTCIGVALLPCSAFCLATLLGYVFCQERKSRKAIACEVSTFNGVLLLGMIHFTLPKLEADLTAMVPCLTMLITPIPFILWIFGHKLKMLFTDKYNNNNLDSMKNMERSRKNSVASSLINDTNVTNLSSSQSPQTGSPIEEQVVEPTDNDVFVDQVTVL